MPVVCGDATQELKKAYPGAVRLAITSPPYWDIKDYGVAAQIGHTSYEQYLDDLLPVWKEVYRVLKPNGKLCINTPIMPVPKSRTPNLHTREIKNINNDIERRILDETGFRRYGLFIWEKTVPLRMFGSYPYPPNLYENNIIEFINVYVKGGKPQKMDANIKEASRIDSPTWQDLTKQIWRMPSAPRDGSHPAPFPESLPARLITMFSFGAATQRDGMPFGGDLILDPFGGSGTTAVAAKKLGRRYLSIDISPDYTAYAERRVEYTEREPDYDVKLSKYDAIR